MKFTIFSCPLFTFSKNETLEIWLKWLLSNWGRLLIEKDLGRSSSPPNYLKDSWKLLPWLISTNLPSWVTLWAVVPKIYSKMLLVSCTNTHHDVTDLVNHEVFKNVKTLISLERNITFLQNEKIHNLCLRWFIFRSYNFVAKVTFKAYLRH